MKAGNRAVGSCHCGAVKFAIGLPVKFCIHCHCASCRAAHGAPLVTWVGVPIDEFGITDRTSVKWYQYTEQSKRGFCINCGTPILYMSTKFPRDIHVTRASLIGKLDILPKAHIFYDKHVDWFPFEDRLPHLGGPEGTEPLQDQPAGLTNSSSF